MLRILAKVSLYVSEGVGAEFEVSVGSNSNLSFNFSLLFLFSYIKVFPLAIEALFGPLAAQTERCESGVCINSCLREGTDFGTEAKETWWARREQESETKGKDRCSSVGTQGAGALARLRA